MGITGEAIATRRKGAVTNKRQAQPEADPVFSAIAAHKEARAAWDPSDEDDEASYEAWWSAYWAMMSTPPTTAAGAAAMFEHLAEIEGGDTALGGRPRLWLAIDVWSWKNKMPEVIGSKAWLKMLASAMHKMAEVRS